MPTDGRGDALLVGLRLLSRDPAAAFRPGQREAISALVEERRRVLLVQRTGWGKSAVYFLATHLLRGGGLGPTLLVSPLLALMRNQLEAARRIGITAATVSSGNQDDWAEIAQRMQADEIEVLLVSPERLANAEDVAGRVASLDEGGLGVVGSREVDDKGAAVAALAAEHAVALGHQVVSGLARGVDQASMAAALRCGGQVVGVPTEGLRRVGRQSDVRRAVLEDRLVLASPYAPDAGFTAGNAMGRNKLIYAMADVTLVVASDDGRGGTWGGAVEALRRGFGRVAVWTGAGAGPGNEPLVRKGAAAVDDVEELFTRVTADERDPRGQGILELGLDHSRDE
jgi:hypothetical protein